MVRQLTEKTDVLIIGGGLVGLACAHYLALDGVDCTVVERGELNRDGSGTNAGSIHIQLREPEIKYSDEVLKEFIPMKIAAGKIWAQIEKELGCDLGLKIKGGFLVGETEEDFEIARKMVNYERRFGLHAELLSPSEVRDLSPGISGHITGAAYDPAEGSANTLLVGPAYARSAEQHGARIFTHTNVTDITPKVSGGFTVQTSRGTIECSRVLNCAGPWATRLTRMVGWDVPVGGRIIQVNVSDRRERVLNELVGHIRGGLTLKQTTYGTFMMGGGWPAELDPRTGKPRVSRDSVTGNTGVALRILPYLANVSIVRTWLGIIAHSLDHDGYRLQMFGELPGVPGYYILSGGTLFTMGPLFARLAAELLGGRKTTFPVNIHRPERFPIARV
jgi:glycine/D-amino acid oxidase-like deaminating enzyme